MTTTPMTVEALPRRLALPFHICGYDDDLSLLLLRHRGPYPVGNEDDSFVPVVVDVMFDQVRALALRRTSAPLTVREASDAEAGDLYRWIEPEPWDASRAYVLGDDLSRGWVIANHVYRRSARMEWYDPSPLLTDLPRGLPVEGVVRNRTTV